MERVRKMVFFLSIEAKTVEMAFDLSLKNNYKRNSPM